MISYVTKTISAENKIRGKLPLNVPRALSRVSQKLNFLEAFSLDLRSLALFRIGLGLVIIADVFLRLRDLSAHYTDDGVLPVQSLMLPGVSYWPFNLAIWNGSLSYQVGIFTFILIFAILLSLGVVTRVATFGCWFLLNCIAIRNPLVLYGADNLIRLLLFWSLFLPLHEFFTVIQRPLRAPRAQPRRSIASFASVAFILQIIFVYFFSALHKTGAEWRTEGSALEISLHIDSMVLPFGEFLRNFPGILKFLTFGVFYLELLGPFLFIIPYRNTLFRLFALALFLPMHLGIALTLNVQLFSWIDFVALAALIPSEVWDFLERGRYTPMKTVVEVRQAHVLTTSFVVVSLVAVFLWNVKTIVKSFPLGKGLETYTTKLALDQAWEMFAPFPTKEDGWYVIVGNRTDGGEVDVWRDGEPVNWDEPISIRKSYKNERWRKYFEYLQALHDARVIAPFAKYLCNQWNSRHSTAQQHIGRLDAYFMKKKGADMPEKQIIKKLRWKYDCDFAGRARESAPLKN